MAESISETGRADVGGFMRRAMHEGDDPEAAYRRGYEQGANAALDAFDRGTSIDKIRDWACNKLFRWRYHDRPGDRTVIPPQPD
jgi:hypothetical protein